MTNNFRDIYRNGMSPAELAEAVLLNEYRGKAPVFPIDPFKLMRNYGIVYQFMDFRDLEGLYLVPEDENDIAVVGVKPHTTKVACFLVPCQTSARLPFRGIGQRF